MLGRMKMSARELAMVVITSDSIKLALNNRVGLVGLSILEKFTDTCDDIEASSDSLFDFSCDDFVGFTVVLSAFGVSEDDPLQTEVFHLSRADLTCERTGTGGRSVLHGDLHVLLYIFEHPRDLEKDRRDDDINLSRVEVEFVQHAVDEVLCLSKGVVALPVATNE